MEAALRTVIELVGGIKVENLFDHCDIIPLRGFDGVRYMELTIPSWARSGHPEAPVPVLDFLKGVTVKVAWPTGPRTPGRSWRT
jgi:NADH-quinone oxidoreductase subunit G/[NiFe] hydrogenase diaphorase moiety small subunit